MLTATYSLIALSIEQRKVRSSFAALEQNVRMRAVDPGHADESELEEMVHQLSRFDRYCHQRKVETCLIPALRKSAAAGCLLSELDTQLDREAWMLRWGREPAMRKSCATRWNITARACPNA